jgi:hypothetical protein
VADDPRQRLEPLWSFLRGFYGSKSNALGERPNGAWAATLADVSIEELREGMRACAIRHPSWPPTAGEFLTLCQPGADIAALDDGSLVFLANELGVKTIGRMDRDGIVRDVQRERLRLERHAKLEARKVLEG